MKVMMLMPKRTKTSPMARRIKKVRMHPPSAGNH